MAADPPTIEPTPDHVPAVPDLAAPDAGTAARHEAPDADTAARDEALGDAQSAHVATVAEAARDEPLTRIAPPIPDTSHAISGKIRERTLSCNSPDKPYQLFPIFHALLKQRRSKKFTKIHLWQMDICKARS